MSSAIVAGGVVALSSCAGENATPPSNATSPVTSLSVTDTRLGTGAVAARGNDVTVDFTGWVYDGKAANYHGRKFDSSVDRGRPLTFKIGAGTVVRGGEQGVEGMKVGGKRTLIVPPDLAYGARGDGSLVPPNAALVFDVELLDAK